MSASDDVGTPTLLADQGGGVYVASLVGPRSHRALEVVSSHDFGATFSSAMGVSDGRGRLAVAWDGGPKNAQELYVNRSADFGATWLSREIQVGR